MFKKLKKFLVGESCPPTSLLKDKDGVPSDHDLHLATLVLLVEVAASDRDIPKEEAEVVCGMMQAKFGLSDEVIPPLIASAVTIRKEKGKLDEFITCINDHFDEHQRVMILAMVWKVVMADGRVDKFEKRLTTQLQYRLQLDDDRAEEARMLVDGGKV